MLLLEVMDDYMPVEVLIAVARCSRRTHQSISPLLGRRLQSANEMRQLVRRMFPGIEGLLENQDAWYYQMLISSYNHGESPHGVRINYCIGRTILAPGRPNQQQLTSRILSVMSSARGRRLARQYIAEWLEVLELGEEAVSRLLRLNTAVNSDFAVHFDQIGSRYIH